MIQQFSKYNWYKISWILTVEVGVIIIIASFFLPGGEDLHRFYLPFIHGCLDCGFVPFFAQWVLWPLSFVPPYLAWPVWTTISIAGLMSLCWYTKVNPLLVILSFPALGQFWLGQIDILIGTGLVIGLLAANPYVRGVGIVLALIKPQIAALAVLILLIHQPRRKVIKVLTLPFVAMIASFIVYGLNWPIEWLTNSLNTLPMHQWRLASRDIWPYGVILILAVFLIRPLRPRFEATLLISALATPFFGVYSYLVFLLFRAPWWTLPLSYAWILMYPAWGRSAMRLAWVLPVGLLGYLFYTERLQGKDGLANDTNPSSPTF